MRSLAGRLLVAAPGMGDPRFRRTVLLMLHHDEDGAFGLILNRPLNDTIQKLWRQLGNGTCTQERHLNLGGPVSGPLIALHAFEALGEHEVPPGLFVAQDKTYLDELVQLPDCPMRLYVGHAGWEAGQLDTEIARGDWLTCPAETYHVLEEHEDLWATVVRQVGMEFWCDVLGVRGVPEDASLN